MLDFARTAEAIGATTSTLEKSRLLAEYFSRLDADDLRRAAVWMTGQPYGRSERRTLNLGWVAISRIVEALSGRGAEDLRRLFLKQGRTRPQPTSLEEVAIAFDEIRSARSAAAKQKRLAELLSRLDPASARYVVKVLSLELRIGLQEGLVEAAIARAFDLPPTTVRRVHMLTGDIGETAVRCRTGQLAVDGGATLFQPVRFMLATPVATPEEVFQRTSAATVWTEEKYDGVRCQLHRDGSGRCELFSRDLKETTMAFPEIAARGPDCCGACLSTVSATCCHMASAIFRASSTCRASSAGNPGCSRTSLRYRSCAFVVAEVDVHDPHCPEKLPCFLRRDVDPRGFQFFLQCPIDQKSQGSNEDMGLDAGSLLVINGAHLDDVLEFAKGPLDVTQLFVDFDGFDSREVLLLGLNQIFALQSFFLLEVDRMLEVVELSVLELPVEVSESMIAR